VQCLPTDIPEHIDIDTSELMLHQAVRVKDLPQDPKWKPLTDPETMLVHVVMPKVEEAPAAGGEAAAAAAPGSAAEPEVIKKGKTEKEGEEPKK
jgi:large subunit ribosomal protein L25